MSQKAVTNPVEPVRPTPWWLFAAMYLLGVLVLSVAAALVPGPLDVDSAYYLLLARSLAQGRGLVVDAIWHFFQPGTGFPQPAGDLWMPMPALLMAPALLLGPTFRHAQVAQVLLGALLPLLAFRIAHDEGAALPWAGLAALMTLFAGTVTVHWVDTDCYLAYTLLGGATLYAMGRAAHEPRWLAAAGFLGGLAAVTRNDGVLLLAVLWLAALLFRRRWPTFSWKPLLLGTGLFLLPVGLWAGRNMVVFGQPTPASLSFFLTMRDYSALFAYRPQADWAAFWAQGPLALLSARASAVWASLTILLGDLQVWGALPLLLLLLRLRRHPTLWPAFLYLGLLFLALNGALPLLVIHGTWSRSACAFLPAAYAGIALALFRLVERLLRWRRSWPARLVHLTLLLPAAALVIAIGLTAMVIQLQSARGHPQTWSRIGAWLRQNSAPEEVIMARDPMAAALYGERRAIGIPQEEPSLLLDIAREYGVGKIVLEGDPGRLPSALRDLYLGASSLGPLTLLWQEGPVQVYGLEEP